jgi:hypothetical protein
LRPAKVYNVDSGADYATLAAAIAAAQTDGVGVSNPGVIRIAPGTYNNTAVDTIPGLAVVGSGVGITILVSDGVNDVVDMESDSSLADLTLKSTGAASGELVAITSETNVLVRNVQLIHTGTSQAPVLRVSSSTATLDSVSVEYTTTNDNVSSMIFVSGSSNATFRNLKLVGSTFEQSRGVDVSGTSNVSIYDSFISLSETTRVTTAINMESSGTLTILGTRILASSTGSNGAEALWINSGTATILNSYLQCIASVGPEECIQAFGGTVDLGNSRIESPGTSVPVAAADGAGTTIRIAHSQLINGAATASSGGTITCAAVTDEALAFTASSCP